MLAKAWAAHRYFLTQQAITTQPCSDIVRLIKFHTIKLQYIWLASEAKLSMLTIGLPVS